MMSIGEVFDRIDWKKMMIGGVLALISFLILITGFHFFFQNRDQVVMKKSEFEYGIPVNTSEQIASIGDEKVYPAMIDGLNINLESSTVHFTEIDPGKLGKQEIKFEQFDLVTGKKRKTYRTTIRVVDSVAPEIKLKELGEIDLSQFASLTAKDIADASDNYSAYDQLKMSLSFSGTAEPGKEIEGLLTVNDENGNMATQDFRIRIRPADELIAIDDPTTESTEEIETGFPADVPPSEIPAPVPVETQQPVESPVYVPAPDPVQVQKPANRSFLFTDGYDMGNVEGACSAAGDASGYGYSCIPIVADNGIYLGMDLIFD